MSKNYPCLGTSQLDHQCPKKKVDHCASVARDLGEIIRFSCNDQFRQKCMNMCKVTSTYECQEVLRKKLMELTAQNEIMKSNGRKRKATSKPEDSQVITIQEAFEKQRRLESAGIMNKSVTIPDENSISLLDSSPNVLVHRVLKQQPITDLFKNQRRIQHLNSMPLKPMISVQKNNGKSLENGLQGFTVQATSVIRESPKIISKPINKKFTISEKSLLDPNNFKWDDNKNEAATIRTTPVAKETKLATSAIMDNDALSIMSDPRIFMWN
ncbi:hypothetical protein LSTR_LSTR006008 [Laodelphax striatellus]|uniref:Uncharacterized protein n=1 Tax=Laodelphax striatellus TaxID=195883 RepID=A0A482XQ20_LAOST|nr:hypothetical protein LSTR_LSTR006008 [Laodelphax striatellus]